MNQTQLNFQKIVTAAIIGALISVAALYIQSTIPKLLPQGK